MDTELFTDDPRSFAMELVSNDLVAADDIILVLLKYMSHDDVREALRINDLAPDDLGLDED
jgi:hypothetical protein